MAAGVHPFALLLSHLLNRLDQEMRPLLLQLFTVDVREVSVVATADSCVQLIRQVFLQINFHDNAQFNYELGLLNKSPPPLRPTGPYLVMSASASAARSMV
jgi:hypothetical protein